MAQPGADKKSPHATFRRAFQFCWPQGAPVPDRDACPEARKRSISAGIQAVKIRKADRVGRFFDPPCSLEASVVD